MRNLTLAVLFASTVVGAAEAADLSSSRVAAYGVRAGQVVFWDFEPGVVTRAYWLPPYGNRHFFPMSDAAPKIGRQENLSLPSNAVPAKSFHREWSSFAIEPHAQPLIGAPPVSPMRPQDPTLK